MENKVLLSPGLFNGIVFLMRESNTAGKEPVEFWFREVCTEERAENYFKINPKYPKTTATKFRNRFNEMLTYVDGEPKLEQSAYFNLNAHGGNAEIGIKYRTIIKKIK